MGVVSALSKLTKTAVKNSAKEATKNATKTVTKSSNPLQQAVRESDNIASKKALLGQNAATEPNMKNIISKESTQTTAKTTTKTTTTPEKTVNNNTTTPAGTKVNNTEVKAAENTGLTQVNAVKTTKSNSLGKVLGVSALAGGTAIAGYSLATSLTKSSNLSGEDDLPENDIPSDDPNWLPNRGYSYHDWDNNPYSDNIDGTVPGDYSDDTSGGYGDGYYFDSGSSDGEDSSIGDTISEFISATSNYLPYIIAGIAGLVLLYFVTKKGGKKGKKTATKSVTKQFKGVKIGSN